MENEKIQKLVSRKVGKALGDYQMIDNGDKILVAVSGGKDSVTLIDVLSLKQKNLPVKFELYSVYVDFGFNTEQEITHLEHFLKQKVKEHNVIKKDIKNINCFWCSWNRRKEIFLLAKKLGCKKVVLGHNLDDIVVTFLMNLFYHGEISTMPPKLEMFNGEILLIRPLVYLTSEEIKNYVLAKKLPIVETKCPYYNNDKIQRRLFLTKLISDLQKLYPNIRMNIFNSLKKIRRDYLV